MNHAEQRPTDSVSETPPPGDCAAAATDPLVAGPAGVAELCAAPTDAPCPDGAPGASLNRQVAEPATSEAGCRETESRDSTSRWRDMSERLNELTQTVERQLSALQPVCERMLIDDDERREQARLRELMHERLEAARPMFQLQLLRPVIQRLASMFDLLGDLQRNSPQESAAGFAMLADHLRETLAQQGVDIVSPQVGDRFDRNLHFVITTVPTDDPACHERISQVALAGFVHVGVHDRTGEVRPVVIRPARVVTWKFASPESPVPLRDC